VTASGACGAGWYPAADCESAFRGPLTNCRKRVTNPLQVTNLPHNLEPSVTVICEPQQAVWIDLASFSGRHLRTASGTSRGVGGVHTRGLRTLSAFIGAGPEQPAYLFDSA